jgi:hypothetical protein
MAKTTPVSIALLFLCFILSNKFVAGGAKIIARLPAILFLLVSCAYLHMLTGKTGNGS